MGGGKVGEYLASVLLGKGHEVAVLESDRDTADHLSVELQGEYLIINGDGCDSDFQEDAGIRKADVFVAVTGRRVNESIACLEGLSYCLFTLGRVGNLKYAKPLKGH